MCRHLVPLICFAALSYQPLGAQTAPKLTISAGQILHGESVTMKASGFTPNGVVLSHLIRPDGSEYPEMPLDTDPRGEFSHLVTIVPEMYGTYELRVTDEKSKASAFSRFMLVPRGHAAPLPASETSVPARFVGVWHGTAAQKPKPEPVVLTISGGSRGGVVGTVAYTASGCGGDVWLIGAGSDFVQLGEMITYGGSTCTGRAIVTARFTRGGALQFEWRDINKGGVATAELTKRSE
jgi:hypothetical protein